MLRNNSIRRHPGFHSVALNMLIANSQVAETPGDGVLARDRLNPLAKQSVQAFRVGIAGNAALRDDGGNVAVGGNVESRVARGN